MSEVRLIVGLGNPGTEYQYTRHNLGFLVVDHLATDYRGQYKRSLQTHSLIAKGQLSQREYILQKPQTYVNRSGVAVKQIVEEQSIALENILVICDDLNLPFGQVRLRAKGSDGGHNGLVSVIEQLQTQKFARLRLGIGCPASKEEGVDYVLEEFNKKEKQQLDPFIQQAVDCCSVWMREGVHKAMNQFNQKD